MLFRSRQDAPFKTTRASVPQEVVSGQVCLGGQWGVVHVCVSPQPDSQRCPSGQRGRQPHRTRGVSAQQSPSLSSSDSAWLVTAEPERRKGFFSSLPPTHTDRELHQDRADPVHSSLLLPPFFKAGGDSFSSFRARVPLSLSLSLPLSLALSLSLSLSPSLSLQKENRFQFFF